MFSYSNAVDLALDFQLEVLAGRQAYLSVIGQLPGFQAREAARRHLDESMERIKAAGLQGEAHLLAEAADPGISELARSLGVDLIVMGTRGITGLKHVLLGSVAERTVRHAPCSVLTVKRADS